MDTKSIADHPFFTIGIVSALTVCFSPSSDVTPMLWMSAVTWFGLGSVADRLDER